jgi:amino acid transporter
MSVVVAWSKYVTHFVQTVSDLNVTASNVQSPVVWNSIAEEFTVTGQAVNIPAIAITIAITLLLFSGIYATAMVNLILVLIKVAILLIFIFGCCKYVNRDNYTPFIPKNEGE